MTYLTRRGTFAGPNGKRLEFATNLGAHSGREAINAAHLLIIGLLTGALLLFLPVCPTETVKLVLTFHKPAIATFPQRGTVNTSSLEDRFQNIKDPSTGKPLPTVEFNKGL